MTSSFAHRHGPALLRTPNPRHQASRRLAILWAVFALAMAGLITGALIHPTGPSAQAPTTGPFSYIPSQ